MLRLTTLGGLAIARDGVLLDATSVQRRRLALLAVLACGAVDAPVSRDRLLALFWSERDEAQARSALKQLTFAIRRQFAAESLFLGVTELRLNPEVATSDVGELLEAAKRRDFHAVVALYTGPFLEGIHVGDAPELERWVEAQRARLEQLYRDARAALAAAAESTGDWSVAIAHWRALAAHDPLDATTARRLVFALGKNGNVAAALRHARAFEVRLRDEVGVSVDDELRAVVSRLRAKQPANDSPLIEITRTGHSSITPSRPPTVSRPRRRWALVAVAVTTLAVFGVIAILLNNRAAASLDEQGGNSHRIVLLPFDVDASDSSLTFLRDGFPDLIDAALAGTRDVRIVDRQAVGSALRDAHIVDSRNPMAIARILRPRLGAADLVAGTVVGTSRSLIVNLRTVDLEKGTELPAFRVAGPLDSLTTIADRLASSLLTRTAGGPVDIDDRGAGPIWMSRRQAASRPSVCGTLGLPIGAFCDQEALSRSGVAGGGLWPRGSSCGPDR